jgi:hypothetical protein
MSCKDEKNAVVFNPTSDHCPIGEITGKNNIARSKIPVLSCEGACFRGEIARLAANVISKNDAYKRGCHGELITVPDSAIARWIKTAEKVVLIDGCFLRCHGRILENIIDEGKLIQFDALSHYKKYNDIFDYDDVPEDERKEVAQAVAAWVLDNLNNPSAESVSTCAGSNDSRGSCCGG